MQKKAEKYPILYLSVSFVTRLPRFFASVASHSRIPGTVLYSIGFRTGSLLYQKNLHRIEFTHVWSRSLALPHGTNKDSVRDNSELTIDPWC